jgi:hypothetical protein
MVAAIEHTLRQGDAVMALNRCTVALQRLPFAAPFQYLRAVAFSRMGEGAEAASEIASLMTKLPADMRPGARREMARAWLVAGSPESAIAALDDGDTGSNPESAAIRAEALTRLGKFDEAASIVQGIEDDGPGAEFLEVAAAEAALAAEPDARGARSDAAIGALTARVSQAGAPAALRFRTLHLLGEMHARRGEDDAAWASFRRAAKLTHHTQFEPQRYGADVGHLLKLWPEKQASKLPAATREPAKSSEAPVFIMGYPDGTPDLLAGLLAGHPKAAKSQHTDVFTIVAAQFLGAQRASYTLMIPAPAGIGGQRFGEAGAYYLQHAVGDRGIERSIDTGPSLIHQGGALALALPAARVIWIDRDPVESCMAGMVGPFRPHIAPTHEALKAATYRHAFTELWGRWQKIYEARGMKHHVLSAQTLLKDPAAAAKEIFGFLGVDAAADITPAVDAAKQAMRATRFAPDIADRFPSLRTELKRIFEST